MGMTIREFEASNLKRRRGKFSVPISTILSASETVFKIMENFLIFRAEALAYSDSIHYEAISPLFDYLKPGLELPEYQIIVEKQKDGNIKVSTSKISYEEKDMVTLRMIDV